MDERKVVMDGQSMFRIFSKTPKTRDQYLAQVISDLETVSRTTRVINAKIALEQVMFSPPNLCRKHVVTRVLDLEPDEETADEFFWLQHVVHEESEFIVTAIQRSFDRGE